MKLPPLRAVHCFESVARNLSFSLAAEELNVTQSAVSHQIRILEDYLGEALFIRQGRKLSLSDTGFRYLEDISLPLVRLRWRVKRCVKEKRAVFG